MEVAEILAKGRSSLVCAVRIKHSDHESPTYNNPLVVKICPSPPLLRKEKSLLDSMIHENLIKALGYEERFDQSFLFLERALGMDLFEQLTRFSRLREEIAQKIFIQILRGVHFLHTHAIAHLDLKLENLLVMESVKSEEDLGNATIKLADFEFAARFSANERCLEKVGTSHYFSPQLSKGNYSPFAADVWAMGVILYALLSGKYPSHLTPRSNLTQDEYLPSEITPEGREFLGLLLTHDENTRPSTTALLEHRWIKERNDTNEKWKGFFDFWKQFSERF